MDVLEGTDRTWLPEADRCPWLDANFQTISGETGLQSKLGAFCVAITDPPSRTLKDDLGS